jgi:hypothetical protein
MSKDTKTAEEILDNEADKYNCRHIGRYRNSVLSAMEQYKDQSIEELRKEKQTFVDLFESSNNKLAELVKENERLTNIIALLIKDHPSKDKIIETLKNNL